MSSSGTANELDPRQVVAPGVLELDLDAIDPIAGVICGARTWALHEGDALELKLPPECADALIMDPPAGIGFMGCAWDKDRGGMVQWITWAAKLFEVAFDALKPGAHGAVWALPRTADWTMQALRRAGFEIREVVVHCFGSGFPKSLDISKAIDAATGARRDVIGSRPTAKGNGGSGNDFLTSSSRAAEVLVTAPATPEAARWAGWGTALKPAHECWIIVRKPFKCSVAANILARGVGGINIDAARVGDDACGWGGGGRGGGAWDEGSCGLRGGDPRPVAGRWPSNFLLSHSSWDESECRACGVVAPFAVRFCPACGSGDVEVKRGGCRCIGERRVRGSHLDHECSGGVIINPDTAHKTGHTDESGLETVDAWECLATCERCGVSSLVPSGGDAGRCPCGFGRRWACAVALLDEQSGERAGFAGGMLRRGASTGDGIGYGGSAGPSTVKLQGYGDTGGASRFFHCFPPEPFEPPPFVYSAKPSTAEREAGLSGEAGHEPLPRVAARSSMNTKNGSDERFDGARTHRANIHPTVKGFHLIGHFCDLLVPPGGLVLDLTAGSGTLGAVVAHRHAATRWRCIMAELDPEHCKIIRERCRYWGARSWRPRTKAAAKPKVVAPAEQPSLFGGGVP